MQTIPTIAGGLSILKTGVELANGVNPLSPESTYKERLRIYCKRSKPRTYSFVKGKPELSDTGKTIKETRRRNAEWRAVCK